MRSEWLVLLGCLVLCVGCQTAGSGTMSTEPQPARAATASVSPATQGDSSARADNPLLRVLGFVVSGTMAVIAFPAELLMVLMDIKC
jgi:hypothetical protein